jgi:hypothetical protein
MNYLALVFCFVSIAANAHVIDCYSGGKKIYHSEPERILYNPDFIVAVFKDYNEIIFTKDCTVKEQAKFDKLHKHKKAKHKKASR